MKKVWVLTANRSEAKVFHLLKGGVLAPVKEFAHPEGKLRTRAFRDREGRDPRDPHRENDDLLTQFARDVARDVNRAGHGHEFEGLILVAGPRVLGALRGELDDFIKKRILAELEHDLPSFNFDENELLEEIWERVPQLLVS